MHIEPIGTVFSCFKEKFGTPRQGCLAPQSRGYIEIEKKWEPHKCLKGLEEFSHAWVLFWFHDNKNLGYRPVVSPPRAPGLRVGALASRSPLRPNPIGLTLIAIDRVVVPRIYISGLDVIEGTPVLDIKPYIPAYDRVAESRCGWVDNVVAEKLPVTFSEQALAQIAAHPDPHLHETLSAILSTDIRNRSDKRAKNSSKRLGFYYADLNVVFHASMDGAHVVAIEPRFADLAEPALCYHLHESTPSPS